MVTVEIRRVQLEDLALFNQALNEVIQEKIYLATETPISLESHQQFLSNIVENNLPQVVAIDNEKIVGWCDILPLTLTGYTHVGRLGMGVVKSYRGKGIGKKLIQECIELARQHKLEKVELEVFDDNKSARELYSKIGFIDEGLRGKVRKVEGRYQDIRMMAYWL